MVGVDDQNREKKLLEGQLCFSGIILGPGSEN